MSEIFEQDPLMIEESLEDWVITKCEDWRDHYESNYEARFDEYYRLWRASGTLLTPTELRKDPELSHLRCSKQ